jgi:hypothetical protein
MMKTKTYVLILALFITTLLSAQVNLEIADGMLVETTGGLVVEVSGDVIENGSGYLKGIVTSGDRSSVAQFAGLTLSSPFNGKITRTTGKQYPGTGTNLTRYYELDNQDSSDLIVNVITTTTTAEHGSLNEPFFHYTKNGGSWKGYGYGSTGTTIVSNDVLFLQNSITDLIISGGVSVKAKIFLEGPYNAANHNMNNSINEIIPLTSPYSEDTRTASNKPSTAVDWVLVQLRDQTTPSIIIASRSAFLNTDGTLIDDNSTLGIDIAAPAGDYYIVIRHRNHLAIMSTAPVTLSNTATVYDFTSNQNKASTTSISIDPMADLGDGNFGMIAGDVNGSSVVNATDYLVVKSQIGSNGYYNGDSNLSGTVNATDYLKIKSNVGSSSTIP